MDGDRLDDSIPAAGLALLEVLIALAITSVLLALIYPVLFTGVRAYGTGSVAGDLQRDLDRVLDRVTRELAAAGVTTVYPSSSPPDSEPWISYQKRLASGWGGVRSFRLRESPDDPHDGQDNDRDGLVDEGDLVWTLNVGQPDEREVVLVRGVSDYLQGEVPNGVDDNGNGLVDERGLALTTAEGIVTVRLTLRQRAPSGHILTRTATTSIRPRN